MKSPDKNAVYVKNSRGHMAIAESFDPSKMVLKTLSPAAQPTDAQITMLKEAEKYPIVYEEDCPELTPTMIEAFRQAANERDARRRAM